MATRHIPAKTIVTCDACQRECNVPNDGMSARRTRNGGLTVQQNAIDWQGSACADATTHHDLCDGCLDKMIEAIDRETKAIRRNA